jgi:hypothetical protein
MTERELAIITRLAALEQTVAWLTEMLLKAGKFTRDDMLPIVDKMVVSARKDHQYLNRSPEEVARIHDAEEAQIRQLWDYILSGLPSPSQPRAA